MISSFCECNNKITSSSNDLQATIQALTDVVEIFFIQQNITQFDYLIFEESDLDVGALIDGVSAKLSPHSANVKSIESLPDEIDYYTNANIYDIEINNSAVIFCSQVCNDSAPMIMKALKSNDIQFITYLKGPEIFLWETSFT
jgi:hypothetical protein